MGKVTPFMQGYGAIFLVGVGLFFVGLWFQRRERTPPERTPPSPATNEKLPPDWPECEEFYNLMQAYRHWPSEDQRGTVKRYNEVKQWLAAAIGLKAEAEQEKKDASSIT